MTRLGSMSASACADLCAIRSKFPRSNEALAGGSKELSNYTYIADVNGFAASGGGGVSIVINRRVARNIFEADYAYSRPPNAVNMHQNNLRVTSGITLRFGRR